MKDFQVLILKLAADLNLKIDDNTLKIINEAYMQFNEVKVSSDDPKDPPGGWYGC
jgi:hypothetical protein